MSKENHGNCWTSREESKLKKMLYEGASYEEMAKALGRSWYACKCRLIRLKLIPYQYQPITAFSNVEKYDTPITYVNKAEVQMSCQPIVFRFDDFDDAEEDTSRTFSNAELNIIIDYFKARLSKLAVQKLETRCFQRGCDISLAENIFTGEINKLKNAKTLTIQEREKCLPRIV